MNLSNEHLQNLGAALMKQTANTHKNLRNVNAAITFLFSLILGHSDYTDTAFLLHHFECQLKKLIAGRLPRDLITPQMLEDVRGNIPLFLKQYNVPLHLPNQSISDLYENPQFVLSKRHNKIFITMSFPLSITCIPLTLFKVIALKMPTDPGNKHVSFIRELPQIVAYYQTQDWYLEFQSMPQISREVLYLIQHNPTALKSRVNPFCFLAVMELDRGSIQRLCQFVIQPYAAEQQVIILGNGRLLLQFVETYTLACLNETRIHQGFRICVVEIPCLCKLIAGNNQYFAKIAHCNSQIVVKHKVQHAININFLQQYFNTSELVPDNQELLCYIPNILRPNLTFEQYELTQSIGLLSTSLFNMSRLAQASLNDSKIFLYLGAVIEANFQKIDLDLNKFSMKTVEMILTFVNPVIVILTFIGFIFLHFRFQALSVAVVFNSACKS
jgi:hypothetical protein